MQDVPANLPSQFLLYAAVFRLAIVGVGIACVLFGYRLLSAAVNRKKGGDGSLVASVGEARLALRNLAPGTMFAAFGMIVVAVMLYQGMPELKRQDGQAGGLVLRGPEAGAHASDLAPLTQRAITLQQAGDAPAAMEAYEQALDVVATPANNLAWLYLQHNRSAEGLDLARLAATLRPTSASALDTLAEAYERTGNHAAALETAGKAAALDPKYREKLEALRREERR